MRCPRSGGLIAMLLRPQGRANSKRQQSVAPERIICPEDVLALTNGNGTEGCLRLGEGGEAPGGRSQQAPPVQKEWRMHRERLGLGAVTLLCALPALALATFQASETK